MLDNLIAKIFLIPTAYAQFSTQTAQDKSSETLNFIQSGIEFLWTQFPRWIAAIFIIFLTFVVARVVKGIVENKMSEQGITEEHQEVAILAGRGANAGILMIGITIGLKVGGIDLTSILAAVAFGIGFALRDLIMNFLAGIMILVSRQFTIGDFIKVNDTVGTVKEIQTRSTILRALDGTKIIVPNADLFTKQVISFTSNPFRRIEVVVGVEYSTDLKLALLTCKKALEMTNGILHEPQPVLLFTDFADSSINISVRFWVDSQSNWLETKSQAIIAIKREFDAVNINIPFPIRTVYMNQEDTAEEIQATIEKQPSSQPSGPSSTTMPQPSQTQPAPQLAPSPMPQPTASTQPIAPQESGIIPLQPNTAPEAN